MDDAITVIISFRQLCRWWGAARKAFVFHSNVASIQIQKPYAVQCPLTINITNFMNPNSNFNLMLSQQNTENGHFRSFYLRAHPDAFTITNYRGCPLRTNDVLVMARNCTWQQAIATTCSSKCIRVKQESNKYGNKRCAALHSHGPSISLISGSWART